MISDLTPKPEIARILGENANEIIERWYQELIEVKGEALKDLPKSDVCDHLVTYLQGNEAFFGDANESSMTAVFKIAEHHGEQRWEKGFTLEDVVEDYRILRAVLLEFLMDHMKRPLTLDELVMLNYVADESIRASVQNYSKHRDQELSLAHQRLINFISTFSHEIRNPIGTIASTYELLREDLDPEVLEDTLAIGERNSDYLLRLIEDIEDISSISQGKVRFSEEKVQLADVADDCVESIRYEAEKRKQKLTYDNRSTNSMVRGDAVRLKQAIFNLLRNSYKYSPEGSSIEVDLENQGDLVVLTVRDTGYGIPKDFLPHIFEMFAQGESISKEGMGIGLSLVKQIIHLHGGNIRVESETGQGTKFIISLPALVE